MVADIFDEYQGRVDFFDNAEDVRPEPAMVFVPEPFTGGRFSLTGISGNDSSHLSTPRLAVEGSGICPDRCRSQGVCFHRPYQLRARMAFPLHVAPADSAWNRQSDGEISRAGSGADGDVREFGT
jgi:hypothetical protein